MSTNTLWLIALSNNNLSATRFGFADKRASQTNDSFFIEEDTITTQTNFNGGLNGGITKGMREGMRRAVACGVPIEMRDEAEGEVAA